MDNNTIPLNHISYSTIRSYCSNQQQFFKNYILGIWDNKSNPAAVVGKAAHKTLEQYYRTGKRENAISAGLQYINSLRDENIDYKKTGSREQIVKEFTQAIQFYFDEEPEYGKVLAAELEVKTDLGFNGEILPLPVKAISDLVTEKDGLLRIWDYKIVDCFKDTEEENPEFIIQGIFNYLTVKAKYNKKPYSITFVQIKKSKNRDGSSQFKFYEIIFDEHLEYQLYFTKLYKGFLVNVSNPNHYYLPNLSDMYNAKESWLDFVSDTINFEEVPQISHKSEMQQVVRDVKFVESKIDTNLTLTDEERVKYKLQEFGIAVEMKDTYKGANVTLYTMKPSRGVRMSQFSQLSNDLALALEAKSVRVQAPIPGTGLVGVEVSNQEQRVVEYSDKLVKKDTLMIPVGEDVYGKDRHIDLAKAPHILIAGATGSGKSVCMDVIINTLIKQMSPEDLKLILVDPKQTEFFAYNEDPHLSVPIITDIVDVDGALTWAAKEMDKRYSKLKQFSVKNIADYRKQANDMPYIVIIIDELSDILLSNVKKQIKEVTEETDSLLGKGQKTKIKNIPIRDEIEKNIIRLAQKARAVGIHLIVATQRPSVNVVTGLIKANFPTRISFMVASGIDSKVILDDFGAEKLVGRGDCLLLDPSKQGFERLQGYFIIDLFKLR